MRRSPAILVCTLLLLALPASAGKFSFQRIADADTPGMGWVAPVSFSAPALDQGRVAFNAYEVSRHGTYLYHQGSVSVVADSDTTIPGSADTYGFFGGGPDLSGENVAFLAYDSLGFPIYSARIGGVLGVVADQTTPAPGGGGPIAIDYSIPPSIEGSHVVFRGTLGPDVVVWGSENGVLSTLANGATSLPGGGPGDMFQSKRPAVDGASVFFRGIQSPAWGLYGLTGGGIDVVANQDTVLPFAPSGIASLENDPSARNGTVAFDATSVDGRYGVYTATGGVIRRVIDGTQTVPGTTDSIDYLNDVGQGGPANDGENVAFTGGNAFGPVGIFFSRRGIVHKVIDTSESLDGALVTNLTIGRDSVDGDRIAFVAWFGDGTQAVYVASFAPAVPMLPLPALLLLGATLLATTRRFIR